MVPLLIQFLLFILVGWVSRQQQEVIEAITWRGLVRYFVLFVIDLKTRQVEIAGIAGSPDGAWMRQIARNWTDCEEGFLRHSRYVIHDRDPLFTKAFQRTLESSGVRPMKLPSRSPNLNVYAERFVRSIKSECLAQVIPIGEGHLRRVVREYVEHYHGERNHQGIGNRLIDSSAADSRGSGSIECRERLGGLLRYYRRAA
jgi:transposase InsO family protein